MTRPALGGAERRCHRLRLSRVPGSERHSRFTRSARASTARRPARSQHAALDGHAGFERLISSLTPCSIVIVVAVRDARAVSRRLTRHVTPRTIGRQRMYYLDLCWEIEAKFFLDEYRPILTPHPNTLEDLITGPFCPRCGRPLRKEVRVAGRAPVYGIENPCAECGRSITTTASMFLEIYQKQLWTEAQRLVRLGRPLPPCPEPDMP